MLTAKSAEMPVILRRTKGVCTMGADPSRSGCVLVVFGCVIIKIRYPIRARLEFISKESR